MAALALAWGPGCGNTCIDLCKEYELYLHECGYGWSTAFEDKGWSSIDDCYDEYWSPTAEEEAWCAEQIDEYADRACY